MKTPAKLAGILVVLALVVTMLAVPGSAVARKAPKCGNVYGPGIGAKVRAVNVQCGNAIRYTNACISRGVLEPGWTARVTPSGLLHLDKGHKRIIGILEGGFTNALSACTT